MHQPVYNLSIDRCLRQLNYPFEFIHICHAIPRAAAQQEEEKKKIVGAGYEHK